MTRCTKYKPGDAPHNATPPHVVSRIHELIGIGLDVDDTAELTGVSTTTVRRHAEGVTKEWGATSYQRCVLLQGWGR